MIQMAKKKNSSSKKEMSEGKAIAIAVLLFAVGVSALIYIIQLVIGYFFPNL
jgi:uncharacterized phage infection (PIP) family protein YhgE